MDGYVLQLPRFLRPFVAAMTILVTTVVGGCVNHVTGSADVFEFVNRSGTVQKPQEIVDAADWTQALVFEIGGAHLRGVLRLTNGIADFAPQVQFPVQLAQVTGGLLVCVSGVVTRCSRHRVSLRLKVLSAARLSRCDQDGCAGRGALGVATAVPRNGVVFLRLRVMRVLRVGRLPWRC